jgi:hypothetical protein
MQQEPDTLNDWERLALPVVVAVRHSTPQRAALQACHRAGRAHAHTHKARTYTQKVTPQEQLCLAVQQCLLCSLPSQDDRRYVYANVKNWTKEARLRNTLQASASGEGEGWRQA